MSANEYDVEDIARYRGLPVCLVSYYAQVGLLGGGSNANGARLANRVGAG